MRTDGSTVLKRVLIIDDNVDAAETLAMLIELSGHSIAVANDGPSGLALAESFNPEIIFLDIGMPRVSGYDIAIAMRQMPHLANVVIVAVTGWSDEQAKSMAAAAGFDCHLSKPVHHDVIMRLVDASDSTSIAAEYAAATVS